MASTGKSSVYVALYDPGDGRLHWALVVTRQNAPLTTEVAVYQLSNYDPNARNSTGPWRTDHKLPTRLIDSGSFIGCVKLPDADIPLEHLMDWLKEQEPGQGRTRLAPHQRWDCVEWIIRVLRRLKDAISYDLDMSNVRNQVLYHTLQFRSLKGELAVGRVPVVIYGSRL